MAHLNYLKRKRERGQTIVLFSLAIVPLLGMVGLVVDISWAYFRRHSAQAAADAAAVAAAMAVQTSSPGEVDCGQNGVWCHAATACPNTVTTPPVNDFQVACLYATSNGFPGTASRNQKVMVAADTSAAAPTAPGIGVKYWITVSISETENQLFSAVLGDTLLKTGARATAAIFQPNPATCIYVLAPTTDGALSANGTTNVQTGCNIFVNSNSSSAVRMVGGAEIDLTHGATMNIVGSYSAGGGSVINPAPQTGASPVTDPFANMTPPSVGNCTSAGVSVNGGVTILNPGVYCGQINLGGTAAVVLKPGVYILKNGLSMAGGTSITGAGVMLYLQGGSISMVGGSIINLTAPLAGPWQGIVIYQDRSDTSAASLTGGATQLINGTIYLPTANLSYTGGSNTQSVTATLVCYTLSFAGNSYFDQGASSQYASGAVGPTLIE